MESQNSNGIYVGIDISESYCMVSYWEPSMKEPHTAKLYNDDESYAIPLLLAKSYGMSRFYQGKKAMELIRTKQAKSVNDLYNLALQEKSVFLDNEEYSSMELFTIFLRRLLVNPDYIPKGKPIVKLVIALPSVDQKNVSMFSKIGEKIGLPEGRLMLIDYRESFYYYALYNDAQIYRHDVMLYEYHDNRIESLRLKRNISSRPQMIRIYNKQYDVDVFNKDQSFLNIIKDSFEGNLVSAVFLTGNGFLGDWMQESLDLLCKNRRVFMGNNLYTKGAVYAGMVKNNIKEWPFVYIGDYEMKMNLSLKVIKNNEMSFITLIEAGESWYESKGDCEVILDGTPEFECWIQKPDSRKADIQVLELKEFPKRENRTTRLRITAVPLSDRKVKVDIKDLGFGEIVPATGKIWEHLIELPEGDN